MASKRLVASIFVKHGQVVKSYGYDFWRPAGDLVTVLEYLDAWSVDEILVTDISRTGRLDKQVLEGLERVDRHTVGLWWNSFTRGRFAVVGLRV